MNVTLVSVEDAGGDVLVAKALIGDAEEPVEARGWVSAMERHYDPEDYGEDGHLLPEASSRAMTASECRAYVEGLFEPHLSVTTADLSSGIVDHTARDEALARIEAAREARRAEAEANAQADAEAARRAAEGEAVEE